jgi:hypothetical protein
MWRGKGKGMLPLMIGPVDPTKPIARGPAAGVPTKGHTLLLALQIPHPFTLQDPETTTHGKDLVTFRSLRASGRAEDTRRSSTR